MVADSESAVPEDAVEVARIIGAWGLQGGLKLKPYAADPQALFASKRWFLKPSEQPRPPGPAAAVPPLPASLRVMSAREQGDTVVATAHDITDRDQAEALKGARVFVSRASFPTADADEFYWVDLIGLDVVDREGAVLGVVAGLIETGPHCVLRVVAPAGGVERLIPFVAAYVDGVDTAARRITVDWEARYDDNG
ncbi:MAG: ribosome maturation factor RimM [Pseudomonadota bacterium]|nr:ribosome maturation factor RimM [Pseudomonadota bacterium]